MQKSAQYDFQTSYMVHHQISKHQMKHQISKHRALLKSTVCVCAERCSVCVCVCVFFFLDAGHSKL